MVARFYWDSDCFLAFLKAESGKVDKCEEVLRDAQDGNALIVTSSLALTEVLKMRGKSPVPKEQQETVSTFFLSPYIIVRNVTRKTAELARELVWNHGVDPKDAIHVATAVESKLTVIHTFDDKLIKRSGTFGSPTLVIHEPFIAAPRLPGMR